MCLAPQVCSALHDTVNRSIQELLTEAEHRHTAHYAATRLRPAPLDVTEVSAIHYQRPYISQQSLNFSALARFIEQSWFVRIILLDFWTKIVSTCTSNCIINHCPLYIIKLLLMTDNYIPKYVFYIFI